MYNQELYDRVIQHIADTRLYEMETSVNLSRGVRRHQGRLGKILAKNIKADLKPEVTRSTKELHSIAHTAVSEYAPAAVSFHANNLNKSASTFFKVEQPKGSEVLKEIIGPNIGSSKPMKEHFDKIGSAELIRLQNVIGKGLAEGVPQKQIIAQAIATTSISENQVKALVRTSITRTHTIAMSKVMEANAEILRGFVFTAVLDSRTSRICSYHNGRFYRADDTRYMPPLHWNCRSTMVPVLKSKKELQAIESDRIKKKGLEQVPEDKLTGDNPPHEDYGTWLKRQPMDVQSSHLGGVDKATLFQSGQLQVKEFFTAIGNKVSIAKLRRLDNLRTQLFSSRVEAINAAKATDLGVMVSRPYDLTRSKDAQEMLRALYISDSEMPTQAMSLTDFRGTTLAGKRGTRIRSNNEFDERNDSFDPFTGEHKSTLLYDPDFSVYQERVDFMKNSKVLTQDEKQFIEQFAESLEDKVSVNNQSVVVENLRILFERYKNDKKKWDNFTNAVRAESQYSVTNVSRILDRRSRDRADLFSTYVSGETPKVQIMGKYFTLQDLADKQLENQRFVDTWRQNEARPFAKKLFYTGKLPLQTFFIKPEKQSSISKKITKFIEKNTGISAAKDFINEFKIPRESIGQLTERKLRETYRNLVDMEIGFLRSKQSFFTKMLEPKNHQPAINQVAKIIEMIADGKSTDYDSLAINIGKQMRDNWKVDFPFHEPTLSDMHEDGSRVLNALRDRKIIRVMSRGKVRRAVIDLDTGRPGGAWKETVSREVSILDPTMLELQSRNRQLVIAQRLGIVSPKDKLYVVPNSKTYLDARGKDSGVSIITRRASGNYDEILVDKDFADMLNHTMSVEYETDKTFATFMDEVVRFRDPRGNVKKYDDLNSFRKLILKRGDQGYGFMQTVKWHTERGKPFTNLAQIDGRGRVYYQGYLTPTGGEVVRPFLNSAVSRQFDVDSVRELTLQIGSTLGPATEALTQAGRYEIFKRNEKSIVELGNILLSTTQRDRRIRDFLEHPFIREHDAEEIPKLTRLALEYARVYNHTKGDVFNPAKLASYRTKLMIENDASSSGAQIIGLSTGDRSISINSNVLATDKKNRLYDLVAMDTASDPEFQSINALSGANIQWTDLAKAAKAQNMVSFYGAGKATQAANIEAKFSKVLESKGYTVITNDELRVVNKQIDKLIKDATFLEADNTVLGLKQLKKEINEVVSGEISVDRDLMEAARDAHPDVGDFVDKLNNVRVGLVGPSDFKMVSSIMSKHLADRAPVTQKFVQFWKTAARAYVNETQKVDVPWVTFDGKTLFQRYRPKVQTSIEFIDPITGRRVKNIYEDSVTDDKLLGKASLARAGIGLGVNGNHMNDASIVRQFHLWGKRNNVGTGTIHDAFFTNIADVTKAKQALRQIYADALEGDTIRNTLKEMRRQGLSEKTYQQLLQQAKDEGLVDPPNKITKADILAPIPVGMDWYGIGP